MPGLDHTELEAQRLERIAVQRFSLRIVDGYQDVDDGFGREARHRGGSDVLDRPGCGSDGCLDAFPLKFEPSRPCGVVVDDLDSARLEATNEDLVQLLVALFFVQN